MLKTEDRFDLNFLPALPMASGVHSLGYGSSMTFDDCGRLLRIKTEVRLVI